MSPPSSPITKRCGRRKPSRLGESQLDPAKGNDDDDDDVPEVVARFFDGTPLTPLKQREIYASFDDHATLSCSGLPDGEPCNAHAAAGPARPAPDRPAHVALHTQRLWVCGA